MLSADRAEKMKHFLKAWQFHILSWKYDLRNIFSLVFFFSSFPPFFPLSSLSVLENTNDYCATDRSKRKTLSGMIPKASVSEEEGGEKAVAVTVVVERHI